MMYAQSCHLFCVHVVVGTCIDSLDGWMEG